MDQIKDIIQTVLAANDGKSLDNDAERDIVASAIANKLVATSLEQLSAVIGGTLQYDNRGQVVIHTGHYDEAAYYDGRAESHKEWN